MIDQSINRLDEKMTIDGQMDVNKEEMNPMMMSVVSLVALVGFVSRFFSRFAFLISHFLDFFPDFRFIFWIFREQAIFFAAF
jgi:hypothetical protein